MMRNLKINKGFTLIELLIVMFILITVGVIASDTFVGALRSGNKTNNINDLRQNGNYIIAQMSKMISYSQSFEGVCKASDDCSDPGNFSLVCADPSAVYKYIKIKSFDGGETIFSCNGNSDTPPNTIASRSASLAPQAQDTLIDTTKMKTTSCIFRCFRSSKTVSPTIGVSFTLASANMGSLAENNSSIVFETSIKPRN
jgi:prepilin-type N-terminal cleavage/methylation domain-containing protein